MPRIRKLEAQQREHKKGINEALKELKLGKIQSSFASGTDMYEVDFNGFQLRPLYKGEKAWDMVHEVNKKIDALAKDANLEYHEEREIKIPAYFRPALKNTGAKLKEEAFKPGKITELCEECSKKFNG